MLQDQDFQVSRTTVASPESEQAGRDLHDEVEEKEHRGMVEEPLGRGSNQGFGPLRANALGGRSAGAVGNALERLVGTGDAVKVADRPRTYRARSAKAAKK